MRPVEQTLRIADSSGRVREVAMRWTASHQAGCMLLFDDPPRTFRARTLFDALADYRATIEPQGWRLLHAAARADCWPDPHRDGFHVRQLALGREDGATVPCFAAAPPDQVADLAAQRANFERWMASLAPVPAGRVRPREGHAHDLPGVDFSGLAIIAGAYLAGAEPDLQRVLARARRSDRAR